MFHQRRSRATQESILPTTDDIDASLRTSSTLESYSTDPYTRSALSVSEEIDVDKKECRSVIGKYGADGNELLHLLEQWTQQLIYAYKQNRERFKIKMKEKWDRGELTLLKSSDENVTLRDVFFQMKKLTEWQRTSSIAFQRHLADNTPIDNIKEIVQEQTEELLGVMSAMISIQRHSNSETAILGSNTSLNETIEQLKRLKKINEKRSNTICIIGLEKAGKSSFINALLGLELLPFKIERCTQIQTILQPPSRDHPDLFATIEFYTDAEFSILLEKLPREKDESSDLYQKRLSSIRQTRLNVLPSGSLLRSFNASDDVERRGVIDKLHPFISDELYLTIVKYATIFTKKLPGENYILLDVPGCDSPILEHRSSAIDAIQNADAFLFLTDGQRPCLTNEQLTLLHEIQDGHFDGMKRAFGIITKLDLCQTRAKYLEHRKKTREELEQKGFLPEHIFGVAANVTLLEDTRSDPEQLATIKERIRTYDDLLEGFHRCKRALNEYIEYDFPFSRYRLVMNIAEQKVSRCVEDGLRLGRQLIPIDLLKISVDEYLQEIDAERWNDIFEHERYRPVLARAAFWQKQTLALKRKQSTETLTNYFFDRFHSTTEEINEQTHPIEQWMLEEHDVAVFQMNPHEIDTREREKIVLQMFQAVKNTSDHLSIFMFQRFVLELEKILNGICPEQGNLFQTDLTAERCAIEVRTLIVRVTHPLILATIRWPHLFQDNRWEAVKELTRLAPNIAFNVLENNQTTALNGAIAPNLANAIDKVLEEIKSKNKNNEILFALFRR